MSNPSPYQHVSWRPRDIVFSPPKKVGMIDFIHPQPRYISPILQSPPLNKDSSSSLLLDDYMRSFEVPVYDDNWGDLNVRGLLNTGPPPDEPLVHRPARDPDEVLVQSWSIRIWASCDISEMKLRPVMGM